jgi:Tfp pilus tip-associated adhesin PilY1
MKTLLRLFASALLLFVSPAMAAVDLVGDDTDLFTRNPNIPSQIPNVLIVLDNSPDWSRQSEGWPSVVDTDCNTAGITGNTQGDAQLCAIYKVVGKLDNQVNVGLMMFNSQNKGGYVKFPMLPMDELVNRPALQTVVKDIAAVGTGVNDDDNKAAANSNYENPLNDAFRYFNSFATFNSPGGPDPFAKADSRGYTSATSKNVFSFLESTKDSACGYDYIIFIGNKFPNTNTTFSTEIDAAAALFNDTSVVVDKTINQTTGRSGDIWTKFMFQYGVKVDDGVYRHVTTYTLDICNAHCDTSQATLLSKMAEVSQGKYYQAKTLAKIETALTEIFQEVQAVNSVFAATTLPVSINVRGTNLNQVYIGVFRPESTLSPRWLGNLKQYKLGVINSATGQLGLVDDSTPTPQNAVNLNTGFISNTSPSIWTESSTFWSFRSPNYESTDAGKESDRPDGDLVEKGGAAQKIRQVYSEPDGATLNADNTSMSRNIYTCTGACLTAPATNPFCDGTAFNSTRNLCTMGYLFKDGDSTVTRATILAKDLGTFEVKNVDLLTGTSSNVATLTVNAGHGFTAGQDIVIAGATPSAYNGQHTIISIGSELPDSTTLTYSVAPSTLDTTHAYVTFPSYSTTTSGAVRPGTDTVDVSATPSDYNITNAAVTAVVGNINQFSYTLSGTPGYPTGAASSYTVSVNRAVTNAVWSSDTGKVTVTIPSHGYTTSKALLNAVVISGASPTQFNGSYAVIGDVTTNTFTYTPSSTPTGGTVSSAKATTAAPSGFVWVTGNTVIVCADGLAAISTTTTNMPRACRTTSGGTEVFNSNGSGTSITVDTADASGNTFSYATGSNPTAGTSGGTGFTATRVSTTDTDTYSMAAVSPPATTGVDSTAGTITLTLTGLAKGVTGQLPHQWVVGDSVTITGVTCFRSNGTTSRACTSSGTSAGQTPFTTTIVSGTQSGTTATITFDKHSQADKVAIASGATVRWSASASQATFSAEVAIGTAFSDITKDGPIAGAAVVAATGTIKSRMQSDLAITPNGSGDKVTSIASQSIATGSPITVAEVTSEDVNERENLIAWVRGRDNKDNENGGTVTTDVRASVHGDVLHSRPAVVNYNRNSTTTTTDDNDVYVFYGANDGMLHAIKGGSLASGGGREQWAFIPEEFFGKLKRLRDQTPGISSSTPRDYFFDGPMGVYTLDRNRDGKYVAADGDKVYLYIGMRRGGRIYYALDVSEPNAPKLLWRKGCSKATGSGSTGGCDAGYDEIGQTWSEPKLGYLKNWPDKLVMIVGAGYDQPVEDFQPCFVKDWYYKASAGDTAGVQAKTGIVVPTPMDGTNCKAITDSGTVATTTKTRSMGRGIFIIDAATGEVLYRIGPNVDTSTETGKAVAEMEFAMPSDLAVLRNRTNTGGRPTDIGAENVPVGYLDRIYATDTGGNIWRVDVAAVGADASTPPAYVVSRLANLASTTVPTGSHPATNYRKFMFNPDVVYSATSTNTQYDAILLGSGDREHPFDMVVNNRFYMLRDKNVGTLTTAQVDSTSSDLTIRWAAPTTGIITDGDSNLVDLTNNCLQIAANCDTAGGQTQTTVSTALNASTNKGWKIEFPNTGEKTVATATTAAGTVIFNTNQPKQDTVSGTTSACVSDLGTARQYGINFQDATSKNIFSSLPTQYVESGGRDAMFAGGGFLPTPVPVVVQIDGKYYQTVIAGVQTTNPGGLKFQSRLRTYWYRKTE